MKKKLCSASLLIFLLFSVSAKAGDTLYVAVQGAAVKTATHFFAKTAATAVYGETVTVLAEKDGWTQVRLSSNTSISGWISSSSLTSKKILIRSGAQVSASADELALAGKGFNKQVEDAWRQDKNLNYEAVDQMESAGFDSAALVRFINEGNLRGTDE